MPIITAKPNIIIFNPSPIFFLRHCSPRIFLYLHTQTRSHSSFNTFCILVFRLHNQRATINYTCSFICIVLPIPSKLSHKCLFVWTETSPRLIAQQQSTRGLKLFFKCFSFVFTGRSYSTQSTSDNLHNSSFGHFNKWDTWRTIQASKGYHPFWEWMIPISTEAHI